MGSPKELLVEEAEPAEADDDHYDSIRNAHDPTSKQMRSGDALGRAQFCVDEIWKFLKYGPATTRGVVVELQRRRLVRKEALWGLQFMLKRGRIEQNEQGYWVRIEVKRGQAGNAGRAGGVALATAGANREAAAPA